MFILVADLLQVQDLARTRACICQNDRSGGRGDRQDTQFWPGCVVSVGKHPCHTYYVSHSMCGMNKAVFSSELVRSSTDLVILTMLGKQAMYGYEIMVSLREAGDGQFQLKQGTLYPLLYRLERNGLKESLESYLAEYRAENGQYPTEEILRADNALRSVAQQRFQSGLFQQRRQMVVQRLKGQDFHREPCRGQCSEERYRSPVTNNQPLTTNSQNHGLFVGEGGRCSGALAQALLGSGPKTNSSVPPRTISSCVIQARFRGRPCNVADWI